MNTYRQLSNTDRLELAILLRKGYANVFYAAVSWSYTIYFDVVF